MGIVRAGPTDLHLVFDPLEGMIAEERDDVVQFALDPIMEQIELLDKVADDLVNSLAPDAPLLNTYKGREGASFMAGVYTNIWYGFIVGLIVAFVYVFSHGGAF